MRPTASAHIFLFFRRRRFVDAVDTPVGCIVDVPVVDGVVVGYPIVAVGGQVVGIVSTPLVDVVGARIVDVVDTPLVDVVG